MRHTSLPPYLGPVSPAEHEVVDPQDIIMSSDGENQGFYPPPPHIAARLNRKNTRRSTASSRRSSVTSLHSSRSNRSCYSKVHNTHIAQHLRRASILESRKARLADRAAHVEQVRLRAQEAKAAPRTSRIEDRALAAQQARERYLAQVAATCAEEVKKAKKIAEEHREKKAAEHIKLRNEMNGRLADAERRRLSYQQSVRRHRTTAAVPVEEKQAEPQEAHPRDQSSAAKAIQRSWRSYHRQKVLSEFLELDLDLASVQKLPFEEVSDLLAQERVIARTGKIMELCGLQDVVGGSNWETTAVRIFLSAYLILGHPQYVLSHEGDREELLMEKAKVLLMHFHRVVSMPATAANFDPNSDLLLSLSEAFSDFQLAFTAWKNHDSSMFVETMIAQFVELDAIWQTVKNDTAGGTAGDYKEGIRYNQTMLLARLKRLTGHEKAMKLVNEAVRKRRRSKTTRRTVEDVKPRSTVISSAPAISLETATAASEAEVKGDQTDVNKAPSKLLQNVMSPLPDNRIVIHELAINKEYRIDVDTTSESRQAINRAVFDMMRQDLSEGLGNTWIRSMAETIRGKLLRVISPSKPLHAQVSEGLDLKIVEKQLELGTFSYDKFFAFVTQLLPRLVAPARDSLVRDLAADSGNDYVDKLQKLMHIIDVLSLDYSNYLLMSSAPELIKHAVSYEQQCFEKELATRRMTKVMHWWKLAYERTILDASRRGIDIRMSSSPQKVYLTGFVDIFIALPTQSELEVPENLVLDDARIKRIRAEILRIVTISSIMLTAKNLLKRDVRTQWRTQAQRMWDIPESSVFSDSSPYISILEYSQALPPPTRTSLLGTIERVLADARATPDISHPVMKVLLQKLKSHVLARLAANSSEERVRIASSASEVLSSVGLAEFVGRIGGIIDEMARVRQVDWDAHGKWLDEVAGEVARQSETAT